MQVAQADVWKSTDDGHGYVGRAPSTSDPDRGHPRIRAMVWERICRAGGVLSDDQVKELGLKDLYDHTDYEALLEEAKAAGAAVTIHGMETQTLPDGSTRERRAVISVPATEVASVEEWLA